MRQKKRWWSKYRKQATNYYSPNDSNHRGGEVDDRTFGNVWTRIWRNRDSDGRIYYSFTQHRLYESYSEVKLSRSYRSDSANDVAHGATWAGREIARRESQELSAWDQDRNRRHVVKHIKQVELLKKNQQQYRKRQ